MPEIGFITLTKGQTKITGGGITPAAAREFLYNQIPKNYITENFKGEEMAPCLACGDFVRVRGLEVDHIDPSCEIRKRQINLVQKLNDNPLLAEHILSLPGMEKFFKKLTIDDKPQYFGTWFFYEVYFNDIDNLWLICDVCNGKKSNAAVIDWLQNQWAYGSEFLDYLSWIGIKNDALVQKVGNHNGLAEVAIEWFWDHHADFMIVKKLLNENITVQIDILGQKINLVNNQKKLKRAARLQRDLEFKVKLSSAIFNASRLGEPIASSESLQDSTDSENHFKFHGKRISSSAFVSLRENLLHDAPTILQESLQERVDNFLGEMLFRPTEHNYSSDSSKKLAAQGAIAPRKKILQASNNSSSPIKKCQLPDNTEVVKLGVPSNGNCFYTALLVGMLLPHINNEPLFSKQCIYLLGDGITTPNIRELLYILKFVYDGTKESLNSDSGSQLQIYANAYLRPLLAKWMLEHKDALQDYFIKDGVTDTIDAEFNREYSIINTPTAWAGDVAFSVVRKVFSEKQIHLYTEKESLEEWHHDDNVTTVHDAFPICLIFTESEEHAGNLNHYQVLMDPKLIPLNCALMERLRRESNENASMDNDSDSDKNNNDGNNTEGLPVESKKRKIDENLGGAVTDTKQQSPSTSFGESSYNNVSQLLMASKNLLGSNKSTPLPVSQNNENIIQPRQGNLLFTTAARTTTLAARPSSNKVVPSDDYIDQLVDAKNNAEDFSEAFSESGEDDDNEDNDPDEVKNTQHQ